MFCSKAKYASYKYYGSSVIVKWFAIYQSIEISGEISQNNKGKNQLIHLSIVRKPGFRVFFTPLCDTATNNMREIL